MLQSSSSKNVPQDILPIEPDISLAEKFNSRQSQEIVIGFAGPIGCGIKAIINLTEGILREYGYVDVVRIKLSDYLDELVCEGKIALPSDIYESSASGTFKRYRKLQHCGMILRERTGNPAILGEYVTHRILLDRRERNKPDSSGRSPMPQKVAYLIDQIKRPEEVKILRAVYRDLFYLVGVTRVYSARENHLIQEGIKEDEVESLMEIDRNENSRDGQRLDKTLHLSNYFIASDADTKIQREKITRLIRLVHGDRSITPTSAERGMYAAFSAGLSSACMSRQVGAAIVNGEGEVISTGCNDVPKSGGGLYTASAKEKDFRCVHKSEQQCFNDLHKRNLQNEIGDEIDAFLLKLAEQGKPVNIDESDRIKLLTAIYENTRLGSLIEFSRAVHAEMDALVSLARNGGSGIRRASLFTTTFPCHNCARHIVAAGISSVYYIEPYEKSLAKELHADSIDFDHSTKSSEDGSRVKFLHFEGVSPRQYSKVFRVQTRKDKNGKFIPIDNLRSTKYIVEYLDSYVDFELKAFDHFNSEIEKLAND